MVTRGKDISTNVQQNEFELNSSDIALCTLYCFSDSSLAYRSWWGDDLRMALYDQLDLTKMTLNELRIQFAAIRVDLKNTEQQLQRTSLELTQLKNRPEKKSPRWKMALGAGMGILNAANSILISVGTGMLASNPPICYLLIAFASAVYVNCILVTTFIVGGSVDE